MKVSCGVFIVNPNKTILIGHPTYHPTNNWSIPKGGMMEGETEIETAVRETFEETGINIHSLSGNIDLLGYADYKHGKKRLCAFSYFLDDSYTGRVYCLSMVKTEDPLKSFPEMDDFKWVSYKEAMKKLHYTQTELLKKIKEKFLE